MTTLLFGDLDLFLCVLDVDFLQSWEEVQALPSLSSWAFVLVL